MSFKKNKPNRRKNPSNQSEHRNYLDELRIDFHQRCGYCDLHDSQMGGKEQFEVDHFIPQKEDSSKRLDYSNLVYSCRICNRFKSSKYSETSPMFIDPEDDDYGNMLSINTDYTFMCNNANEDSTYIYKELKFYLKLRQKLNILNELYYIESQLADYQEYNPKLGELYQRISRFRCMLIK